MTRIINIFGKKNKMNKLAIVFALIAVACAHPKYADTKTVLAEVMQKPNKGLIFVL